MPRRGVEHAWGGMALRLHGHKSDKSDKCGLTMSRGEKAQTMRLLTHRVARQAWHTRISKEKRDGYTTVDAP